MCGLWMGWFALEKYTPRRADYHLWELTNTGSGSPSGVSNVPDGKASIQKIKDMVNWEVQVSLSLCRGRPRTLRRGSPSSRWSLVMTEGWCVAELGAGGRAQQVVTDKNITQELY